MKGGRRGKGLTCVLKSSALLIESDTVTSGPRATDSMDPLGPIFKRNMFTKERATTGERERKKRESWRTPAHDK